MKKKTLAFSIACAVLFAETAAAFSVSAEELSADDSAESAVVLNEAPTEDAAKTDAADSDSDADAEDGEADETDPADSGEEPQPKKITVKAYQITTDHVKILLNKKEIDPETDNYYKVLSGVYASNSYVNTADLPEDTALVYDWFLSEDGYETVDRLGKPVSDEDHEIYYMTKQIPVHYLRFDAGEGSLIWESGKSTYSGKIRALAEDEIVVADHAQVGSRKPSAEWGDRKFEGWFTEPEGGKQLTLETVITGEKEQTYYAHWGEEGSADERTEYYVNVYYMDSEESAPRLSTVVRLNQGDTYGKILSSFGQSSRAVGTVDKSQFEPGTAVSYDWYSEKEGGFIFDYSSDAVVPGDTSVYYRKGIYRCHYISFDAGDGEIFWNTSSPTYYEGNVEPAKSLQMLAMEDHKVTLPSAENGTRAFLGWFTEPEGGTQYTSKTYYKEKGDITLYAHWDKEGTTEAPKGIKVRIYNVSEDGEITVSFDYRRADCENYLEVIYGKNNAIRSAGASTYVTDSQMQIPDGMTYQKAYFSAPEGGQQVTMTDPLLKNEDHALYSRYDFVPYYHVLFDANGGKVAWSGYKSTSKYPNDRTLKDDEIAVAKGGSIGYLPNALNGTRRFLGWFTEPDGGERIESYTYFKESKDTTYYAHWDEEGTVEATDEVLMKCYTLNNNTSEYTLYCCYRVKPGTTYATAVRSALGSSSTPKVAAGLPEGKVTKTFWYSDPLAGFCADRCTDPVSDHDFAVYARSEVVGYHYVTFNPGDGVLSKYDENAAELPEGAMTTTAKAVASSTSYTTVKQPASDQILVTDGSTYGEMLMAFQKGKEFLGWFTAPVGGKQITEDSVFTGTGDQTLYAHYSGDPEGPDYLIGDVDGNGEVQSADAQAALIAFTEIMTGNPNPLTPEETLRADVDGDGKLTVNDPQLILIYYTANKVSGVPTTWEDLLNPQS